MLRKNRADKNTEENVKFKAVKTDTLERATEKKGKIEIVSFVWTLISSVYTIATVIYFVVNNWVPNEFNGALIALLVIWVVAFIVIIGMTFGNKDVERGQKALKIYTKSIKIFKGFVNVMFVAITVVSFAGVATAGINGFVQWIVMSFTLAVAVVQLGLKIAIIFIKLAMKRKGKGKKLEVVTFVNGEKKENKVETKVLRKLYHTEDEKEK